MQILVHPAHGLIRPLACLRLSEGATLPAIGAEVAAHITRNGREVASTWDGRKAQELLAADSHCLPAQQCLLVCVQLQDGLAAPALLPLHAALPR